MTTAIDGQKPASVAQRLAALLIGAVCIAILLGLGTWQMRRLAWKEDLLATIQSRISAPPVQLKDALLVEKSVADMEYTPVTFSGVFDHRFERHFFATFKGATGFYVYTPLKLEGGDWIFVNRGFVPYDKKDPAARPEGQVAGPVVITGLMRPGLLERPSSIVPDNDPAKNIFYWKDFRAMRDTSGLPESEPVLGLFVDANDAPNPGGLPVGGVTIIDQPNNHLQYALTWYGLAAALAGVLGLWLWRGRAGASS
jgi:surfeit locus 1 family protein